MLFYVLGQRSWFVVVALKQAPWQMILGTTPEDSGQQPLQIKYPKNISHEVHRSEEGGAFLASCYQEINVTISITPLQFVIVGG